MNQIKISVDTDPGHTNEVVIECGDQKVEHAIPDTVIYGVDGVKPEPRALLKAIVGELQAALAKLAVTSLYSEDKTPTQAKTEKTDFTLKDLVKGKGDE